MPHPFLPDDVLYRIFEILDLSACPFECRRRDPEWRPKHPLIPFYYVCRQWMRVADKLVDVNLHLISPDGLVRLLEHLRYGYGCGRFPTKRLWIERSLLRQARKRDQSTLPMQEDLTELFTLLGALKMASIPICLSTMGITVLFETAGRTLEVLELRISRNTLPFIAQRLHTLVQVKRIDLVFSSADDDTAADTMLSLPGRSKISIPSLRSAAFSFSDWWPECNDFLAALNFVSLEHLWIKTERLGSNYTLLLLNLVWFLQQHSAAITDLHVVTSISANLSPFLTPLQSLRSLRVEYCLWKLSPRTVPASIVILHLPLFQTQPSDHELYRIGDWATVQAKFFRRLLAAYLPNLKIVQTNEYPRSNSALDWAMVSDRAEEGVLQTFKSTAVALKLKGVQLLDVHGNAYTALSDAVRRT
ncbi:hypothetical protein CALCODRAFT_499279 [Calocera cornea HHB12733]|uniref:F-box domain-containing protein n=1 Tax=Calocera cornea HHB12733 TaxID=1353952 RepID=A0A165EH83_9BASI|nr:hypothetical protein CALCODRAFT_499279 [Calocera cornea HHB12733]